MNHGEKATYHNDSSDYLKQNHIRELFQKALLQLTLKQPEDPISFLIKHFGQRKKFQVYSIIGLPSDKLKRMADNIANENNFKFLTHEGKQNITIADSTDYSKLLSQVDTLDRNYEGVLFYNFPVTKVEKMFMI